MGQCCSGQPDDIDYSKSRFSGPVKRRTCTDVPCCLLFILFLIGFLVVTLWSFAMGDYRRILYPTDSKGRVCGTDVPGKQFLYFFDLQTCVKMGPALMIVGCPTPQVCVSACPDYYWSWKVPNSPRENMICLNGLSGASPEYANQTIESLVKSRKCAPYIYHSAPVLGRCMPSQLKRLLTNGTDGTQEKQKKLITFTNAQSESVSGRDVARSRKLVIELIGFFEKVMNDLSKCWPVILVCLLSALILGFSWIVLLRFCAGFMVWTMLAAFVLFFSFATGFCFYRWHQLRKAPPVDEDFEFSFYISHYFRSSSTWLTFAIISTIILVIIVIVLIFLRKRIRVAIAILNETSKAVATMTSVLFWPLMPLILELVVILQCVFVAICLRSIADPIGVEMNQTTSLNLQDKARQDLKDFFQLIPCDPTTNSSAGKACRFLYYGDRKYTIFLQFFNLFMFFWLVNFVKSLAEMTLAGTFAHYYFSRLGSNQMPKCPLLSSLFRAVVYHMGSLAFGSFLIALLQWLRALLEYIDAKLKKADNAVARFFMKCLCCCLWCLEKFLRFLNRNAFIMIAIYGQSFCSASRSALHLLARNIVRLIVVDKVTDFILFIGKVLVVGAISAGVAYCYLEGIMFENTAWVEFQPTLHYPFVPLLIIIISCYIIVTLFSSVYEMGVDTIFLCFLEDLERNDGSPERPYFMSKELMAILGKQNKVGDKPEEA